jgi:putative membrane protein
MASEKGSNADVKAFGQMMVKDHTQANSELKQVASQLKVQPPAQVDQKHKDLADKLSKLSGAEFDREYINAMVTGHEEVLGKLRGRAEAGVSGARGAGRDRSTEGHDEGLPGVSKNSNKPVGQEDAAKSSAGKGAAIGHGQGDEALTQWAAKVMPTVQKHLDRAREIQKKVAK